MRASADLAARIGAFEGFEENKEDFIRVMQMHLNAAGQPTVQKGCTEAFKMAYETMDDAIDQMKDTGIRNAQLTVLAPTGTISFMMDCATTGIEPEISLVKYKLLAGKGDGLMKLVNPLVPDALRALNYEKEAIDRALEYIEKHGHLEGFEDIIKFDLPVFDCAFKSPGAKRAIDWTAHIEMMAACQPFVSGAISKTVNMPEDSTVEEIEEAYMMGWRRGLKAVAIYRENSKRSQPLSTSNDKDESKSVAEFYDADDNLISIPVDESSSELIKKLVKSYEDQIHGLEKMLDSTSDAFHDEMDVARNTPVRRRIPREAPSTRYKLSISGHEGYIHVGLFPDTLMPGGIFVRMSKEGSTISGMMDSFATAISLALQYGVPLEDLVRKFKHVGFEPSGFTGDADFPSVNSVIDYIFRYLAMTFVDPDRDHILKTCYGMGTGHPVRTHEGEATSGVGLIACGG